MKVKAKRTGYIDHHLKSEGDVFELVERKGLDRTGKPIVLSPEMQFSEKWMVRLDEKIEVPKARAGGKKLASVPTDSDVI